MPTCVTLTDIHDLINIQEFVSAYSAVASSIIGGGGGAHIHILVFCVINFF